MIPAADLELELNSSSRKESQSFEEIFSEKKDLLRILKRTAPLGDAQAMSVPLEKLDLDCVPELQDALQNFYRVRDERFLTPPKDPNFQRRSSWLYPHDGCYARSALTNKRLGEWGATRPKKLFIFGNLTVNTPNAKEGKVSWWYHVVPLARNAAGEVIVLDPAIYPDAPLPLKKWAETMGDTKTFKFAICDSYTFGPFDSCIAPDPKKENDAVEYQYGLLQNEWDNLVSMKRNPYEELGSNPPWLHPPINR